MTNNYMKTGAEPTLETS